MAKELTLPGNRWRATHQATVDTVLGKETRPIISRGDQFLNKDNWTARFFISHMCEWSRLNSLRSPERSEVQDWVLGANKRRVPDTSRKITIAATPDELPRGLAMALVGGAYHEAWHTKYSRRTPIHLDEVYDRLMALWALAPNSKEVKGWTTLADSLLTWSNVVEDIRIERIGCQQYPGSPQKMWELQDLILKMENISSKVGCDDPMMDLTILMVAFRDLGLGYETLSQKVTLETYEKISPLAWGFVTQGPLKPLLDRVISLGPEDDLECLWIAMEIVGIIANMATRTPKTLDSPKQDPESGSGLESGSDGEDSGSDGESVGESDGEDSGSDGESVGESAGEESGSVGEDSGSDGESVGESAREESGSVGEDSGSDGEESGSDGNLSTRVLKALQNGGGTWTSTWDEAFLEALAQESYGSCEVGEQPWSPLCPDLDSVRFAPRASNKRRIHQIRKGLRREIAYLKSKLRSKFLLARRREVIHGVSQGQGLSERRLVNSMLELRSGRRPTRPDWQNVRKLDCTLATAVVLDQSGSMAGPLRNAAIRGAVAIADPLDSLGSPCLVVGPMPGSYNIEAPGVPKKRFFHRRNGVHIDVFKNWDERFSRCCERFGSLRAGGKTPLSDGIQYALRGLSDRTERFRVVLVITDGLPDRPQVVRRQIRLAAEAGVHIVGIGIGGGATAVQTLFPLHVYVEYLPDLPIHLIKILDSIMFPRRGDRIKLDDPHVKLRL